MIETIGIWSHALAAAAFGALGVWQARRVAPSLQHRMLICALAATAFWAFAAAADGPESVLARIAEGARNLGWLGFMFALLKQSDGDPRRRAVSLLYAVVGVVVATEALVNLLRLGAAGNILDAIAVTSLGLRIIAAIGGLVLVHNLYTAAAPDARSGIRLPMVALAAMWTYDLNLYAVASLGDGWVGELYALRGLMLALLAPVFALAARRNDGWRMKLSRTVAFQSLSLVAIGGYLALMILVTTLLDLVGGDYARAAQVSFVFGTTVAALALLPSDGFRAWFKVKVAKHFFQHRYDYRSEWLRFTDTIGSPGEGAAPLDERIVQAIADITESPGGLLLLPDESGGLGIHSRWTWEIDAPPRAADAGIARHLEATARIIEFDALRGDGYETAMPEWMIADRSVWAGVPLIHFERLVGVVLLKRPPIDRTLDWEDFDLLRVVAGQAASYLAEARGQEALSEARRFDEFNRRFAFIMHDIKNLVSQLTLTARNAERHADNPEFRADMIATLKDSAGRMNDLLARLSQHHKGRHEEPRAVAVTALAEAVAAAKRSLHPVSVEGQADLLALADAARLEQILGHLIQNAIDASPPDEPVCVRVARRGIDASVEILDRGSGMSADFVRSQLFKPFASTKSGGFGVGAFEARALAASMGGRIEVESREGEGSRFTLILPQPGITQEKAA